MTGTIPLGELITIRGGGTPSRSIPAYWNGEIRWATVKDFKSTELAGTEESITPEGVNDSATNIIPAGSVIVPTRMAVGKAAINTIDLAINQDLKALLPGGEVDSRFLLHFMLAQGKYLESQAQGATVKGIKLDLLRSLPFPKIPPSEQRRIAAILDKADAICRKREQGLVLADDFLKSAFLELFGDPNSHSEKYENRRIADLGRIETGKTPPTGNPENHGTDVPFVTPGDLGGVVETTSRTVSIIGARHTKLVQPGATLVCCIGATIGKMGFLTKPASFNQQINAITWGPDIDPIFGYFGMTFLAKHIAEKGTSTTLPIINKSQFSEILLRVPEISLQRKYSSIVKKVWSTGARMDSSLQNASDLFSGLSQRAFRGEL